MIIFALLARFKKTQGIHAAVDLGICKSILCIFSTLAFFGFPTVKSFQLFKSVALCRLKNVYILDCTADEFKGSKGRGIIYGACLRVFLVFVPDNLAFGA